MGNYMMCHEFVQIKNKGFFNIVKRGLGRIGFSPLGVFLLLAVAIAIPLTRNEYFIGIAASSLMYGALAIAFDFTAGFINIVNFGFAAFLGLGAYTSAIMTQNFGYSPFIGTVMALIVSGILGLLLSLLVLRLAGIFAACMTWFVALALMSVIANWVSLTNGYSGLSVNSLFATTSNLPYFYLFLILTIVVYIITFLLTRSHMGMAFKAIGMDIQAAQSSGVNATKYKIINFTISCSIAGLIGAFYADFVGILTPKLLDTGNTMEIMTLAYIGGLGSLWGGVIVSLILTPTMEFLNSMMQYRLITYGVLMILVMLFYPLGVAGLYNNVLAVVRKLFNQGGEKKMN